MHLSQQICFAESKKECAASSFTSEETFSSVVNSASTTVSDFSTKLQYDHPAVAASLPSFHEEGLKGAGPSLLPRNHDFESPLNIPGVFSQPDVVSHQNDDVVEVEACSQQVLFQTDPTDCKDVMRSAQFNRSDVARPLQERSHTFSSARPSYFDTLFSDWSMHAGITDQRELSCVHLGDYLGQCAFPDSPISENLNSFNQPLSAYSNAKHCSSGFDFDDRLPHSLTNAPLAFDPFSGPTLDLCNPYFESCMYR